MVMSGPKRFSNFSSGRLTPIPANGMTTLRYSLEGVEKYVGIDVTDTVDVAGSRKYICHRNGHAGHRHKTQRLREPKLV